MTIAEDIDLLLRMLGVGAQYAPIEKILIDVYIDTSIVSLSRQFSATKGVFSYQKILTKNASFLRESRLAWEHYAKSLLFAYYRLKNKSAARTLFWQMLCRNPSMLKLIPRVLCYELK
ncbi:hypothetical protein [Fastidiosibacter lacustris]|uniref:hypothetical protein n=1 Tax=Fastidiosibacter lacustris TaxID=2056695 RepID=UPI000E349ADE|nr:hypothetical protein [Fastidiosibacter lacustris]